LNYLTGIDPKYTWYYSY